MVWVGAVARLLSTCIYPGKLNYLRQVNSTVEIARGDRIGNLRFVDFQLTDLRHVKYVIVN